MASIFPEVKPNANPDANPDAADAADELHENTSKHESVYTGDFFLCEKSDFDEKGDKFYYPAKLFVKSLDDMAFVESRNNIIGDSAITMGADKFIDKFDYGVKRLVSSSNTFGTNGDALVKYLKKHNFKNPYYVTKYNGELDVTIDDNGETVYTVKKINSFLKRICDKFGKCFTRSRKADAGGSKKRVKKTRKQRKHRNSKRNHKK